MLVEENFDIESAFDELKATLTQQVRMGVILCFHFNKFIQEMRGPR
jgi:hypothetical protein